MSKKHSLRTIDNSQLQEVGGASAGIGGFGGFRINGQRRAQQSNSFDLGNLVGSFLQSDAGKNLVNKFFESINKLFA
jgi:hypothetical protein